MRYLAHSQHIISVKTIYGCFAYKSDIILNIDQIYENYAVMALLQVKHMGHFWSFRS
jgi:hypothetical protein